MLEPGGAAHPLMGPGPFNPVAVLPTRVVKRILDLEFLEMAEVSLDSEPVPVPGRPPPPGRTPVQDISQWIERFSLMAATLTTRFPEKAPEFFAYQATIVRAERNYEEGRWVAYDRQFRREALARRNLNWSATDPCLYNEAFTGRARAIPRCNYCLRDDHTTRECPQNQQWEGTWPQGPPPWLAGANAAPSNRGAPREVCRRYNQGKCRF